MNLNYYFLQRRIKPKVNKCVTYYIYAALYEEKIRLKEIKTFHLQQTDLPLSSMTEDVVEITKELDDMDNAKLEMLKTFIRAKDLVLWLQTELKCKYLLFDLNHNNS